MSNWEKSKKEVNQEAKEGLAKMPKGKGWIIRIWKNFGWHWSLDNKNVFISIYPNGDRFYALSDTAVEGAGDMVWGSSGNFKNPMSCVRQIIRNLSSAVKHQKKLKKSIGVVI